MATVCRKNAEHLTNFPICIVNYIVTLFLIKYSIYLYSNIIITYKQKLNKLILKYPPLLIMCWSLLSPFPIDLFPSVTPELQCSLLVQLGSLRALFEGNASILSFLCNCWEHPLCVNFSLPMPRLLSFTFLWSCNKWTPRAFFPHLTTSSHVHYCCNYCIRSILFAHTAFSALINKHCDKLPKIHDMIIGTEVPIRYSLMAHQFLSSTLTSPLSCCLFNTPFGWLWVNQT